MCNYWTKMKLKNLISSNDLSLNDINNIFDQAKNFESSNISYSTLLSNKFLASMFFEPSTRTRFSFEVAFRKLGGNVFGFSDPSRTAMGKGESFIDTVRIIQNYSDIIVLRHPFEGYAKLASENSEVPIINAGDGTNEHPTQALTDLYTIKKIKGKIDGLKIAICGDLKNGRDIHSLCLLLSNYKVEVFLIAPPIFQLPNFVMREWETSKFNNFSIKNKLQDLSEDVDVLYLNRIQKERIKNKELLNTEIDFHKLNNEIVSKLHQQTIILNPMPRSDELPLWIDSDPRAKYFEEAKNGLWLRMSLFYYILGRDTGNKN